MKAYAVINTNEFDEDMIECIFSNKEDADQCLIDMQNDPAYKIKEVQIIE